LKATHAMNFKNRIWINKGKSIFIQVKLRLPICEIWCNFFNFFARLFILFYR